MIYEVLWPDPLLEEVARQYLRALATGFATDFTLALHRIENRLTVDPLLDSESRGANIRVTIESPVTLYFRIEGNGLQVTILDVLFSKPRDR